MIEEIQFPEPYTEEQESLSQFVKDTYTRLVIDHPELLEKWGPLVIDTDPHGRLMGATAAHALLDLKDLQKRIQESEQQDDEHRRLA